jgi:cytochrome c biogenesis protein CcmG/thiol:disulfide interchange protein DsbE
VAPFVALAVAAVLALVLFVFARADPDESETARTPLMGRPAPAAVGQLDGGGQFDLARRKGSWVVLNFFDSTCVPCVQEHPALLGFDATQDARGREGAELVTVVWGEHPDGAREFFAAEGVDWPVVFDDGGRIATAFGVTKVPETWIIDPAGFVVWRTISTVTSEGLSSVVADLQAAT